ncbi:protein SAWADEE HOMEODOMAIN HOMOLOG 1 isoform X5 [Gossypium hirsutum]|uniref:Protein SAWADEE HOMEODOMAIN HOMOLOG 1 isoform X5 n=1 Tax=Gossypium hirsutum TaxID=3635 RepID=A0A1U8IWC6_GOSHI|nr:protein SAWADEE HOMEODOMAIN HOMOLOG 1 isoform X5 [Gossypium hirsutum]
MEKLFMEPREQLQSKEFCQKLARNFSSSSGRAGKPIVKWNEVQNWFTTRQQESEVKVPSVTNTYKDESGLPQTCFLNYGDQSCQILKGFGAEEDEWVNVKKAVQERSIPFNVVWKSQGLALFQVECYLMLYSMVVYFSRNLN